jgi:preprotein translocase subunit SecA
MLDTLLAKVVGTQNDRELKRLRPLVAEVNALEPAIKACPTNNSAAKRRVPQRAGQRRTLDDLLVEAFAVVREAGRRVLNMRHFDVQLIGGAVLHKGKIAR